jgi:hypothetical protein
VRLQKSGKSRSIYSAGWSSLVARRAHNPEVVGSNPTPATMGTERENLKVPFSLLVTSHVSIIPILIDRCVLVPVPN